MAQTLHAQPTQPGDISTHGSFRTIFLYMRPEITRRLKTVQEILRRPWVRVLGSMWVLSGIWDLVLSQWIPEDYARRCPKVYQVIAVGTGMLSWQLWAIIGAAITVLASIEYAHRNKLKLHAALVPLIVAPTEWKKPFEAIESFADQPLVAAKNKWLKTLDESLKSLYETAEKIAELEHNEHKEPNLANLAVSIPPHQESRQLTAQRIRREGAVMGEHIATDELRFVWADLREDMRKKLESGELAAKGVPAPYVAGKSEADIAPHEWRLLTIDPGKEQAIEKNGGEVKYVGIVIRKLT